MKIAFWSNEQESGVTSNLTAVSIASVLAFPYRILMMENHTNENGIAKYLFQCSRSSIMKEQTVYYLGHGATDCLVEKMSVQTNRRRTDFQTIEVIEDCLFYVPQKAINEDLFEYEFHCNLLKRLKQFDTFANVTMIDTRSRHNLSSKIILEEADLVVVNLQQNTSAIDEFFLEFSSILHKCVFLISSFHPKNRLEKLRISRHFPGGGENLAFIPYNLDYQVALFEGRAIQFISSNYMCTRGEPNYLFIKELKSAAFMIMEKAKQNYSKKTKQIVGELL
ncbi:MAG: hypothetical protein E7256_13135 [Lachnospiraceae bacterium]|nr:hypothetical protein [Lachnospiraceae bacterium]